MNDCGPWAVQCGDFADRRPRSLLVSVRGSEVVVMAPPGETAVLDSAEAEQFRSVFTTATTLAATPEPGGSGRSEEDRS